MDFLGLGAPGLLHGVEIGVSRSRTRDLEASTEELIESLSRTNPRLTRRSNFRQRSVGGRTGLQTTLSNVSDVTRQEETIQLVTTTLRDGSLMYIVAVAPERDYSDYQPHFQRVVQSIRLIQ